MDLLTATIRTVKEVETFTGTDYKKQSLFVESLENKIPYKIDFSNEKIDLLKDILIGGRVMIEYRIRGNYAENNTKLFNSFEGYSIKSI
jgi:hypothetical protein